MTIYLHVLPLKLFFVIYRMYETISVIQTYIFLGVESDEA